ncbi:hypothetical protein, partial [Methylobrevis pamukkalensis]|uniref:hypothetical protein n=1 Tax=Methylobrevis pamukkalensis TaxID=1439726 RepID=UPI0014712A29
MRITIVVPSEEFLTAAGMRIRYARIMADQADPDVRIAVRPIGDLLGAAEPDGDVFVFAKVYDARAAVLAHRLKRLGRIIGQDLFDDYFSQAGDPRLARFRAAMADLGAATDFAVCSTPAMARVAAQCLPGVPVTVVGDPVDRFEPLRVADIAARKLRRAQAERRLSVVWFGMGDNPYFPVGLHDLVAFAGELGRLRRAGFAVDLEILTNPRAMTREALGQLRGLPVDWQLAAWSEAGEAAALEQADVAFIPVGGQGFSIAKSLNRAISALAGGCQLLAPGYPLYPRSRRFSLPAPEDL